MKLNQLLKAMQQIKKNTSPEYDSYVPKRGVLILTRGEDEGDMLCAPGEIALSSLTRLDIRKQGVSEDEQEVIAVMDGELSENTIEEVSDLEEMEFEFYLKLTNKEAFAR